MVHYRACGALGSTNQNWLGAKLLPMAVSVYPVVCVHPCHPLRTQHHCLWPKGREGPHSVCPSTPTPPIHLLYKPHSWYYRGCKIDLKKQQWILHGRVSYEHTNYKFALLIQQILRDYNVAQESHSCFNILKQYFLKYKMWQLGWFF